MKTLKIAVKTILAASLAAWLVLPSYAQESEKKESTGAPDMNDPAMMAKMMELTKLNENHNRLASLDGTWSYTVKMWMNGDPTSKPDTSKGTATRKSVMGGRYISMDVKGMMSMPGADGKMTEFEFLGHSTEGYDNAKQKFVGTWYDNMGTGIMMSEGTYDEGSKTFTYTGEYEPMPGMKMKVRETLKLTDKDHMVMEWYEDRGGKEMKTMEIDYTREK